MISGTYWARLCGGSIWETEAGFFGQFWCSSEVSESPAKVVPAWSALFGKSLLPYNSNCVDCRNPPVARPKS